MSADSPVAHIRFRGGVEVRPFRRGTYLDREHLDALIERSLADRDRFGSGRKGYWTRTDAIESWTLRG